MMHRRWFLRTVSVSLLAAPLAAEAQTSPKVPRVGFVSAGPSTLRATPSQQGFDRRISELGWVEGQNVVFEFAFADGKIEKLPALAADLAGRVDLMVAVGSEFTLRAAAQASRTIPIVMIAINYDPVARGYLTSLARPTGNVTGVFLQQVAARQHGLEPIANHAADPHELDPVANEFARLPQGRRRDPDGGQEIAAEQEREALGIDPVVLEASGGDRFRLLGFESTG